MTWVAAALLHAAPPVVRFVTYDEAWPVMKAALAQAAGTTPAGPPLPPEFSGPDPQRARDVFVAWVKARDAEVRARVLQGEEDSLVPLLLFGTGYTKAPRLTRDFFDAAGRAATADGSGPAGVEQAFARVFERRTDDLLKGMLSPGANERLASARATCQRHGPSLDTAAGRAAAGRFLVETFARVTRESGELAAAFTSGAGTLGSADALAGRARAFAHRGLAPDTSWPINFALSGAIHDLKVRDLLSAATPLRRIAILGPGLDFVDKDEGHDFYPPQTLQPFAVIETLLREGLASVNELDVLALDLNPRVTAHVRALATRPAARPYDLLLTRDARAWTTTARAHWASLGHTIGREVAPPATPSATAPATRAVRVRAEVLRRLSALDVNIVHQRVDLPSSGRMDLVVATNILVYYDAAEQAMAIANIAGLLRPGGLLLTNTRLDDLPGLGGARVGETLTVFSDRPGDGEVIYAYRLGR